MTKYFTIVDIRTATGSSYSTAYRAMLTTRCFMCNRRLLTTTTYFKKACKFATKHTKKPAGWKKYHNAIRKARNPKNRVYV